MSGRQSVIAIETEFRKAKALADAAIAQVGDADLHVKLNPRQNSIAVVMQHIAGNAVSRFTDFLTTDGEKPTRDRESEFADRHLARSDLLALWKQGWKCLFDATAPLADADLGRIITIRNEPHTVLQALIRQIAHYGWHVGQIALLAKHFKGDAWAYLTIAPNQSAALNRKMMGR
jgi:hypothetical protein